MFMTNDELDNRLIGINIAYYRKIKNNDIAFIESASYDNKEKLFEVERMASF